MSEKVFNPDRLTDLVWLQTSFIGDIILSTAAMRIVREKWPHLRQHLITHQLGARVLKDHPALDHIFVFEKRDFFVSAIARTRKAFSQIIQSPNTTVLLQPHRSTRSSMLAKAIGLPTITYTETGASFLAYRLIRRDRALHEKDRVSQLLEPLGASNQEILAAKLWMPTREKSPNQELVDFFATSKNVVAIAAGSHWATKMWPEEKYLKIASKLLDLGYHILLIGGAEEQSLKDSLRQQLMRLHPNMERRVCAVATSLDDLTYFFPKLKLLVSNDSSPVHYASAYNIPTIAIFGPTLPEFGFTPLADVSFSVELKGLKCRPCSAHGPQKCPLSHFKCMRDLDVEAVWQKVEAALQR